MLHCASVHNGGQSAALAQRADPADLEPGGSTGHRRIGQASPLASQFGCERLQVKLARDRYDGHPQDIVSHHHERFQNAFVRKAQ